MSVTETRERKSKIWERDAFDWYQEPPRASEALFEVERFVGPIWDPACGSGTILRVAEAAGYTAFGTDIVRRTDAGFFKGEFDFLDANCSALPFSLMPLNIVCNPPFYRGKGAEGFIRRALSLSRGKVATFLDICFLAGAERANNLFNDYPPHRIWIVTPRVSCPP